MTYFCLAVIFVLLQIPPTNTSLELTFWISLLTFLSVVTKAISDHYARKATEDKIEKKIEENTTLTKEQRKDIRHDIRGELTGAMLTQVSTAADLAKLVDERERKVLEELANLRLAAESAFREANNCNQKLLMMQKMHDTPQQVEVINDPQHPVPVQDKK